MTIPFAPEDAERIIAWLGHRCPEVTGKYLPCDNESDWLAERRNGIGASEIGVIVGASKWSSPYALWWRKKLDWRVPGTESMRWGHMVEDPIAELFAEQMAGLVYVAKPLGHPYSLWYHPVSMWATCTPDRLAVRKAERDIVPVEIKSDEGGYEWGEPHTDQIPEQYRCQALWQAFVFGAAGTFVVRKRSSGRGRVQWYWVPWDANAFAPLFTAANEFLSSIDAGEAPDPDGSDATADTLKGLYQVVEDTFAAVPTDVYADWVTAREAKANAIRAEKLASNMLREAMGTANYATYTTEDGLDVVFAKRRVGKRNGYTVASGTVDELRGIGDGLRPPGRPVPGPNDASPPPQTSEEGEDRRSDARGELGAGPGETAGEEATGEDPRGPALEKTEEGE